MRWKVDVDLGDGNDLLLLLGSFWKVVECSNHGGAFKRGSPVSLESRLAIVVDEDIKKVTYYYLSP